MDYAEYWPYTLDVDAVLTNTDRRDRHGVG